MVVRLGQRVVPDGCEVAVHDAGRRGVFDVAGTGTAVDGEGRHRISGRTGRMALKNIRVLRDVPLMSRKASRPLDVGGSLKRARWQGKLLPGFVHMTVACMTFTAWARLWSISQGSQDRETRYTRSRSQDPLAIQVSEAKGASRGTSWHPFRVLDMSSPRGNCHILTLCNPVWLCLVSSYAMLVIVLALVFLYVSLPNANANAMQTSSFSNQYLRTSAVY